METAETNLAGNQAHLATSRLHFRNILVTTDLAGHSIRAQEVAVSLARRFGARLIALHVTSPVFYAPGAEVAWTTLLEADLASARCRMEQSFESIPGWRDLRHEELVETGPLMDAIERVFDLHRVDLIVCGSHGAGGFERAALGSAAEMILRRAPVPVLVVGPNCGSSDFGGQSILLSTSLRADSCRAAQYAAALAEELNASLTQLHLAPALEEGAHELALRHRLCGEARALLPADIENWCRLKTYVLFGENNESIATVAAREKAELIVMGVHEGHAAFHGLADHLPAGALAKTIRLARCPVLAVRGHFGA